MRKKHACFMAFMAVWVLAGCQALQNIVKSPSVQMESAALKSTSLFQGDLEFTFNVSNPNPIGARLDGFSYQLAIEGKKMLEGQQAQGIGLPAMGSKSVTVPITVNYMESFDSLLDFFRKDSLTYEISGTFQVGLFTLPFSHTDVITLPKPPSVRVKGVSVTSMSLVGAKLAMDLEVSQEGKTNIDLKKINYAVSLGGIRLFDGQSENIILSDDATSKIVTVPLSIDFLSLGKSAIALFSKGAIDYELTGNMEFEVPNLGVKTFPFTKTGNTDLIR